MYFTVTNHIIVEISGSESLESSVITFAPRKRVCQLYVKAVGYFKTEINDTLPTLFTDIYFGHTMGHDSLSVCSTKVK